MKREKMKTTDEIYLKGLKQIGDFLCCNDRRTVRRQLQILGIEPKRVGREIWVNHEDLKQRIEDFLDSRFGGRR